MSFQQTEGIILRAIPFGDYDQILSIFTRDAGLIKVLIKGSRSKRRGVQGICLPLTGVEVTYREKNSEIFSCKEIALVESYHFLRGRLIHLETACDLLRAIIDSQLTGKAAPQLYALLCFYLHRIPQIPDPWIVAASFRLKVLFHEGMLALPDICCECGQPLQGGACSSAGGWHCLSHREHGGIFWSSEELACLESLSACQRFRDIFSLTISSFLFDKITSFFNSCLNK